jgi:hypothetical protein
MKFLVNVLGVETEIDYDIATALNQDEQTALLTAISDNTLTLDSNIDTVNSNLVSILNKLITSPATEAKQDSQITELQALKTRLDSLLLKDFATETTLSLIKDNQTNSSHITKIAGADGTIATVRQVNTQVISTDKGQIVNSIIHGLSTGGGGNYVDVKVNPSGALTVEADTGLLQPLTDTELRASPVPVSGTVTANTGLTQPLTDAELRASPVPVSGTFYQATQPVSLTSVPSHDVTNAGTFAVQVTSAPTIAVTGTFYQATQPVSLASLPSLATGSNTIGAISNTSFGISGALPAFASTPTVNAAQSGIWDIGTLTSITNAVAVTDNSGSLTVDNNGTFAVQATQSGTWNIETSPPSQSIIADTIVVERDNQIEMPFHTSIDTEVCTTNTTGSGTATISNASLRLRTGAANSSAEIVSLLPVLYKAGNEMYYEFTVVFSAATTLLEEEIGGRNSAGTVKLRLYRTNNVVNFSILDAVDGNTTVAQSSWNGDTLDGGVNSKYTYNGSPQAKDWTKGGLFRLRYAWFGFANILLETLTPDGKWITCHTHIIMNQSAATHLATPELYPYAKITSAVGGTDHSMYTGCIAAGVTNGKYKLNSSLADTTLVEVNRSVIAGRSTSGGGTYYNVKVSPSGAMEVGGTVAATQSGTWNIGSITTLPSLATGSNVIGKVSIDQTTPGTTDSVTVKAGGGLGSLTETAPATDTASSGLNGRLQRIAQNITSLIAIFLPKSLYSSSALENDAVVKASAGVFYGFLANNTSSSDLYIQIHNVSSVPADGAVPVAIFPVYADTSASYQANAIFGWSLGTGIYICLSSTAATKTLVTDVGFFTVEYS